MFETIPAASVAGMAFTLIVAVGVPIAAFILAVTKLRAGALNALIGAGTFIVSALILERLLHAAVLSALGERLTGNVWLYALYGGLAAGLFEETGRLLSMRFLMKNRLTEENAVMYGIGHGGAESLLLVGMTYVSNLAAAVMINAGALDLLLSGLDASARAQAAEQLSALWTTPPHLFFLAGVERLSAFALQICLSCIVCRAVRDKKPALFILAVALHFAVDAGAALLAASVSVYVVEGVLLAAVACLSVIVLKTRQAEKT